MSLLHRWASVSAWHLIVRLTAERDEARAQLRAEKRATQTQADLAARWRSIANDRAPKKEHQ